jgi:HD-GYP domain-containing protein (c-di-GMP phosphodiesterase class II)
VPRRGHASTEELSFMRYTLLSEVKHRIAVDEPLPFHVYNKDRTLLLAKGMTVDNLAQMQALFERGTLVDLAELHRGADLIRHAPAELLPALWTDNMDRVERALRDTHLGSFREALDEVSEPVNALIDRDPDLAIFQVMRQDSTESMKYGIEHSIHCAIVCRLVARRLQWAPDEATRAFKSALTMNLSMLELQGVLAGQRTAPTDEQRRQIHSHPIRSREMLEHAGVTDADWLRAVEQHHEQPDRSGYPYGINNPSEMATLLQRADVYTAKLSARSNREPMAADRAGREIFMRDPSNPITAALVKEFGVYPPGCYVALASGETGIVVKRGPTVMAPVVAAMTDRHGDALPEPVRRDTTQSAFAVVSVVPAKSMKVRMPADKLALLAA